ncbi:MAG: hypothetical protein RTV72_01740 [Candidatus Thorarchaeota archaeon]
MRRAIIALILIISLLSVVSTPVNGPQYNSSHSDLDIAFEDSKILSDITKPGSNVPIDQSFTRLYSNQILTLANSFSALNTHENSIDLSSYQIPGWTLHKVIIDTDNITAIPEREVAGSTATPSTSLLFAIDEPGGPSSDVYVNQLAQGFYNMSHDGQLLNISLLYMSPAYDPSNQNYAYIDIRSDYQNGSTNMVSSVQLDHVGFTPTWANVTESIVLDAGNEYYAMINGTKLLDVSDSYPDIRWWYENTAGSFLTSRYSTEFSSWGTNTFEAILNYTYIPWNKTSGSALVYSNPISIDTTLNGTPVTGTSWVVNSVNNITSLPVTTNQSVNVFYDLTLTYSKDNVGNTVWRAPLSGDPILWNVTTDLTYPAVSNIASRTMNITNIPLDWVKTGLYIGSTPGGSYSESGTVVTCNGLSDGTWTLTSTAPNYATDLALSDSSDSSPIIYKVANLVTMDVDATIEDGVGTPMNGGSTNLSILQSSNLIFSPAESPASGGAVGFQWDISSTTNGNGTHSVEVYWVSTDGLEAGYMAQEVFVFLSTTLVADDYSIAAYTDNTFDIGIDFNSIYPANGLDDGPANVTYSFGITTNDTMDDAGGGRWTKTISTATMSSGSYILTVYAEGFALENQSLTIDVELTIATEPLVINWTPSNVITFLESTNLTVAYSDILSTPIADATVNVTFDGTTYDMKWDGISEFYWIQLNGTDFVTVPGSTPLTINAWKSGYTSQYNDTASITVNEEPTGTSLVVTWNPVDRNITYIETITIYASYTYNSNPITDSWSGASVNVTFSGFPLVNMVYNDTSQFWEVTLDGSDYFGVTTVTIRAAATGYGSDASTPVDLTVVEDIPMLTNSWPDSAASIDYANTVLLQVTVRDSSGASINDATLTLNVFGVDHQMIFFADGVYNYTIDPVETRGSHVVNVTMVRVGYRTSLISLDLTVRATTDITVDYTSPEYEQWNLNITVTYTDAFHSTTIEEATVTVTIDGVEFTLLYDNGVYTRVILLDFDPGTYTITVVANAPFCNEATESPSLQILAKSAVYLSLTTEGDPSAQGQVLSIIATLRYNGTDIVVPDENIHFVVTIYYVNGTIEIRDSSTQYDTTNDDGDAIWGFEIPSGSIDRISILAEYVGSRVIWDTSLNYEVGVGANPLLLILSFFFMSDIGRMIVASMIILGIVATAYNKRVKPKKRAARASLENQLQMFRDLETLRHFMAVYLDRGTCVFYHPFTDERIQPDLISGFIAAITSVYGEIKGDGVRGTLEEIQYHGLRLNSYSGEFIIGILILEGEMTPLLKERLQFFVELFENQYDQHLTDWNGLIDCFDPEWVVSTLSSAFNYSWLFAHRFGPTQKIGKTDSRILDYISAVRDERSEFYFRDLLTPLAEMLDMTEAEVLDRLLILQDKGIIAPVSIQTILQRQGMGLANGEIGPDTVMWELPEKEEPEPLDEPPRGDEPDDFVKEDVPEVDEMDEFVKDVESLLTEKKEKDENEES